MSDEKRILLIGIIVVAAIVIATIVSIIVITKKRNGNVRKALVYSLIFTMFLGVVAWFAVDERFNGLKLAIGIVAIIWWLLELCFGSKKK